MQLDRALMAAVVLGIALWAFLKLVHNPFRPEGPIGMLEVGQPRAKPTLKPKSQPQPKPTPQGWEEFARVQGLSLTRKELGGRVVRIEGKRRDTGKRLDLNSKPSVLKRAQEVLESARALLQLQGDLGEPRLNLGTHSAHVTWDQMVEGVPLSPGGDVVLNLGRQGEVLGLHSRYKPKIKVLNKRTLSATQATGKYTTGKVTGSPFALAWIVEKPDSNTALVRHAYEVTVDGHQTVIDAQTGMLLFKRDQRRR